MYQQHFISITYKGAERETKEREARPRHLSFQQDSYTHLHVSVCSLWGTQITFQTSFLSPSTGVGRVCTPWPLERDWREMTNGLRVPVHFKCGPECLSKYEKRPYLHTQDNWSLPDWIILFFFLTGDFRWREHAQSCPLKMSKGLMAQDGWGQSLVSEVCWLTSKGLMLGWFQTWMSRHVSFIFLDVTVWPLEPNTQNPLAGDQIALGNSEFRCAWNCHHTVGKRALSSELRHSWIWSKRNTRQVS